VAKITGIHSGGTVGKIISYSGTALPSFALACDGTVYNFSQYPALAAVILGTYGGNGTTTFGVPNAQGVFIRGAGTQTISSISYTGTQGSTQGDQLQGHYHSDGGHTHTVLAAGQQSGIAFPNGNALGYSSPSNGATGNGTSQVTNTLNVSVQSPSTDGTNGTPRTGTTTHPANITVKYCIIFK
jgi:microcystin-dependent protein